MNILYIACSCDPNNGSEDRIGWKIPLECASRHNVTVITRKDKQKVIEEYIKKNNITNPKFYFVDIPDIYKKICKGFLYTARLSALQKRAFAFACELCAKEKFDIIHQITPVEFRSIGNYGKIPNVKFVCGPVGGGEYVPYGLHRYLMNNIHIEVFRWIANQWALVKLRLNKNIENCDSLLFANKETQQVLSRMKAKKSDFCFSETGIDKDEVLSVPRSYKEKRVFLVSGRLVYRKGHSFLLDALSELPSNMDYICYIVGDGVERKRLEKKCRKNGIADKIVFTGRIRFEKMQEMYSKAHVLIVPSLRETTGSVILEAMSKGMPVITVNRFGGAVLLNEDNSWLYDGSFADEFNSGIKKALSDCILHSEKVESKSVEALKCATENIWENKVAFYESLYKELMSANNE